MKRNLWKAILIALCAASFCVALTACGGKQKPYNFLVTFNYNYSFKGDYKEELYLGIMESDPYAYAPGTINGFDSATFDSDYELEGWYLPKTDEDGNLVYTTVTVPWTRLSDPEAIANKRDLEIKIVDFGEKWDFKDPITEDVTLYAKYKERPALVVVEEEGGWEYDRRSGDEGSSLRRLTEGLDPKKEGYTFVEFFKDAAFTEPLEWPVVLGSGVTYAYAQFLEGDWQIVTDTSKLNAGIRTSGKLYIPDFVEVIDFSAKTFTANQTFRGTLEGNGCVIRGISLAIENRTGSADPYALFGKITAGAVIRNVTFEADIAYSTTRGGQYYLSFFADTAEEGATLENITVRGNLSFTWEREDISPTAVLSKFIRNNSAKNATYDDSGVQLKNEFVQARI